MLLKENQENVSFATKKKREKRIHSTSGQFIIFFFISLQTAVRRTQKKRKYPHPTFVVRQIKLFLIHLGISSWNEWTRTKSGNGWAIFGQTLTLACSDDKQ